MNEKKERRMSAKGFLAKTNSKAAYSAGGFLQAYREYLLNGEVAYVTKPIIERLDEGALMPTPALNEIKHAVLAHILEVDRIKAEESIEKAQQQKKTSGTFVAKVIDAATGEVARRVKDNGEIEELIKGFDMPQDAERWVDRRLFDGSPSWYGTVTHTKAHNPEKATDIIERGQSIARILRRPGRPAMKAQKQSTSQLGWGVKVRESAIRFSRG